jgi:hypothetical protein
MSRVIALYETLSMIFAQAELGACAAAIRVCRLWYEPAANEVWRDLPSLLPLFSLLAPFESQDNKVLLPIPPAPSSGLLCLGEVYVCFISWNPRLGWTVAILLQSPISAIRRPQTQFCGCGHGPNCDSSACVVSPPLTVQTGSEIALATIVY